MTGEEQEEGRKAAAAAAAAAGMVISGGKEDGGGDGDDRWGSSSISIPASPTTLRDVEGFEALWRETAKVRGTPTGDRGENGGSSNEEAQGDDTTRHTPSSTRRRADADDERGESNFMPMPASPTTLKDVKGFEALWRETTKVRGTPTRGRGGGGRNTNEGAQGDNTTRDTPTSTRRETAAALDEDTAGAVADWEEEERTVGEEVREGWDDVGLSGAEAGDEVSCCCMITV